MEKHLSKLLFLALVIFSTVSCSNEEEVLESKNTGLYSGKDITSYASILSDAESKKLSVEIKNNGSWKFYAVGSNGDANFDAPMLQGTSAGIIQLNSTNHQIFCLEWADGSRAAIAPRQLPIKGQPNFRDLGGYKTKEGRYIKWGLVFRSGKCNSLTSADISYLATTNLKTVIDLRSNEERSSEPDKLPNTVVSQKHLPIDPGNLSTVDVYQAIATGNTVACRQYLIDANESLVLNFQNEYKAFFEILMDKQNAPVMFHCTAGKDRAGFGSAMFLAALGVDKETIINDYLLTNTCAGVTLESMKAQYGDTDMAVCMYYIYSVQREYIEKAFSTIEAKYGSVDKYLTDQLKVDVKKMKDLYLY